MQYCEDGERVRYDNTPPVVEVSPDAVITPDRARARRRARAGACRSSTRGSRRSSARSTSPAGEDRLAEINTSDVVPPAFYLVIVEDKGGDCGEWSGAWPVGFLRAGGDLGGTPTSSAPPAG